MVRSVIVTFSELGTNCWLARRFIESARCDRVYTCRYAEHSTCKAIQAEITFLRDRQHRLAENIVNIFGTLVSLEKMLQK